MRWSHRLACIGLVLVAGLPIARAAEPPHREHLRIAIALDIPGPDVARYAAPMIDEADAIWRLHGVRVVQASGDYTPVDVRLNVIVKSRNGQVTAWRTGRIAYARNERLGAIVFDHNGRPADVIAVDPDAIAATVKQPRVNPCDVDACPPALLKLVTTRALGRVLAHEIGHYLLALPAHAPCGLMRAAFTGRELAELDRATFALSPELLPRLRDRLERLRSAAVAN